MQVHTTLGLEQGCKKQVNQSSTKSDLQWRSRLTFVPWSISVMDAIFEDMNTTCAVHDNSIGAEQPSLQHIMTSPGYKCW